MDFQLARTQIPADYLPSICARLFARQQLDVDLAAILSRPGTASAALRRSAKPTSRLPPESPAPPATAPTLPKYACPVVFTVRFTVRTELNCTVLNTSLTSLEMT